ncbi:hypothetical protein Ddc_15180 [Ditylenchus destructor]|nr:hypothetical protein Ddc_15180 [Ditylenchus destructor]
MRSFISIQLLLVASIIFLLNIDESVAPPKSGDVSNDSGFDAVVDEVDNPVGGRVNVVHASKDNGAPKQVPPHAKGTVASDNRAKAIAAEQAAKKQEAKPAAKVAKINPASNLLKETESGKAAGRNDRNVTA